MPHRHYVFDAYGTLFDVHSAAKRHAEAVGPAWRQLSETWRAKQLEYTWVRACAGRRRSFWQITIDSLDYASAATGARLTKATRDALLEAYRDLEAYPEVAPVLGALKARGSVLAILSNGDPEMLERACASAGLVGLLDRLISVEEAGTFKPLPQVYALVTERYGIEPKDVSFQSSNRWDIAGASAFGFSTVWINRTGRPDEYPDLPPGRTAASLDVLIG